MTQQHDPNAARRAAATLSELDKAKRSLNPSAITLLARIALAVVYLYLIVMAHTLMGITGPVYISVLFLVALFAPYVYQAFTGLLLKRRDKQTQLTVTGESRQEA